MKRACNFSPCRCAHRLETIIAITLLLFISIDSTASESGEAQRNVWAITVSPYVWMTGLKGSISIGDLEVPVDESFSDILKDIELGMMLGLEAHNGTWGLFGDIVYADLKSDREVLPGVRTTIIKQWLVTAGASYRLVKREDMQFDIGAGIRYSDAKLRVSGPLLSASDGSSGVDPIIIARLGYQPGDKVFFLFSGGIGGFGVESDLIWQLSTMVGYNLSESMALLFGYRHFDYELEDDVIVNLVTRGFVTGMSFRF